jgi:hypothetical protein
MKEEKKKDQIVIADYLLSLIDSFGKELAIKTGEKAVLLDEKEKNVLRDSLLRAFK